MCIEPIAAVAQRGKPKGWGRQIWVRIYLERFSYFVEPDGTFFGSDSAAQHEVLMQCGAIERHWI